MTRRYTKRDYLYAAETLENECKEPVLVAMLRQAAADLPVGAQAAEGQGEKQPRRVALLDHVGAGTAIGQSPLHHEADKARRGIDETLAVADQQHPEATK